MRMQLEIRQILGTIAFFIAGGLLAAALVQLPLVTFDWRLLVYLVVGLIGLPIMRGEIAHRYLALWTTLAGAGGILRLIVDRLECGIGNSACVYHDQARELIAVVFYVLIGVIGLLLIRRIRRVGRHGSIGKSQ
jgi:hypothetical protein